MNIAASSPTPRYRPQTPGRRTAFVAGALYLVTFLTSVPTVALYQPVLDHADFVLGAGSTTGVLAGACLEVLLALSCVGTAVVLFPIARRHSEAAALGFVASRVIEGGLILIGVASLLSIVTLREDAALTDPASLLTAGQTLVAVHDRSFLLGQSLMPAISALCLGSVLYRSGLVPRAIPMLGLVGAPLLLASDAAILWGGYSPVAPVAVLAALPIALWELALAVWLVARGFLPTPVVVQPPVRERDASAPVFDPI
ncbi:DUF4386 domain-containing protein [Rhodococcus sp. ACT016]|uniref:DUF4386 domain-containing protein n=1 Tax=Rhodococcus sp. ACT016 TaxID=3134808 RepID=UPI003D2E627A